MDRSTLTAYCSPDGPQASPWTQLRHHEGTAQSVSVAQVTQSSRAQRGRSPASAHAEQAAAHNAAHAWAAQPAAAAAAHAPASQSSVELSPVELPDFGDWKVQWQCEADAPGSWYDYEVRLCISLEQHFLAGSTGFEYTPRSTVPFHYDPVNKVQKNLETRMRRVMRRVLLDKIDAEKEQTWKQGASDLNAREHTLTECYRRKNKASGKGKAPRARSVRGK